MFSAFVEYRFLFEISVSLIRREVFVMERKFKFFSKVLKFLMWFFVEDWIHETSELLFKKGMCKINFCGCSRVQIFDVSIIICMFFIHHYANFSGECSIKIYFTKRTFYGVCTLYFFPSRMSPINASAVLNYS